MRGQLKVKATWNDGIDGGEYTVAAISRDYKNSYARQNRGKWAQRLYVALNGDDGASGTENNSTFQETLAGAREKVKALEQAS